MNPDLQNIIRSCRRQDKSAQNSLYGYTYERLLNCTLRYTKNLEEGQWIFNLAMLKVFNSLDRFEIDSNYLAWARDIIVKTSIDHLRKNIKYQQTLFPTEFKDFNETKYDLNLALDKLETEEIFKLIQALPERERLIFSMYEIDGFTHIEIEKETGIKKNTSKWLLAKAKKNLQQQLTNGQDLKLKTNG